MDDEQTKLIPSSRSQAKLLLSSAKPEEKACQNYILFIVLFILGLIFFLFYGYKSTLLDSKLSRMIERPLLDQRNYRLLELSNDLKVLLIQDAFAPNSCLSLELPVGLSSETGLIPGISHLLAHLVLTASRTYPPLYFDAFLRSHAGDARLQFSHSRTNFGFCVHPEQFNRAIEIFSSHIREPSFSTESLPAAVELIDEEWSEETWDQQITSLMATLTDQGNMWNFPGNKEFLQEKPSNLGIDIINEAELYYNEYYSSNLMALVLCSNHSLDVLEKQARDQFLKLKNNRMKPQTPISPSFPSPLSHLILHETRTPNLEVGLLFPIPKSTSVSLLLALLNSKAEAGLYDYLSRTRQLIYAMEAERVIEEAGDLMILGVRFEIPKQAPPESIMELTKAFFGYISWLKTQPMQIKEFYYANNKMKWINFNFQPPETDPLTEVSQIAQNMLRYPAKRILDGDLWGDSYNNNNESQSQEDQQEKGVQTKENESLEVLEHITPTNVVLTIGTSGFEIDADQVRKQQQEEEEQHEHKERVFRFTDLDSLKQELKVLKDRSALSSGLEADLRKDLLAIYLDSFEERERVYYKVMRIVKENREELENLTGNNNASWAEDFHGENEYLSDVYRLYIKCKGKETENTLKGTYPSLNLTVHEACTMDIGGWNSGEIGDNDNKPSSSSSSTESETSDMSIDHDEFQNDDTNNDKISHQDSDNLLGSPSKTNKTSSSSVEHENNSSRKDHLNANISNSENIYTPSTIETENNTNSSKIEKANLNDSTSNDNLPSPSKKEAKHETNPPIQNDSKTSQNDNSTKKPSNMSNSDNDHLGSKQQNSTFSPSISSEHDNKNTLRSYYLFEPNYRQPKAAVFLDLAYNSTGYTTKTGMMMALLAEVMAETLARGMARAVEAGNSLEVRTNHHGMEVCLEGFNGVVGRLLDLFFPLFSSLSVSEFRFLHIKSSLIARIKEEKIEDPIRKSLKIFAKLMTNYNHIYQEKVYELEAIDYYSFTAFLSDIQQQMALKRLFIYGNIPRKEALELEQIVYEGFRGIKTKEQSNQKEENNGKGMNFSQKMTNNQGKGNESYGTKENNDYGNKTIRQDNSDLIGKLDTKPDQKEISSKELSNKTKGNAKGENSISQKNINTTSKSPLMGENNPNTSDFASNKTADNDNDNNDNNRSNPKNNETTVNITKNNTENNYSRSLFYSNISYIPLTFLNITNKTVRFRFTDYKSDFADKSLFLSYYQCGRLINPEDMALLAMLSQLLDSKLDDFMKNFTLFKAKSLRKLVQPHIEGDIAGLLVVFELGGENNTTCIQFFLEKAMEALHFEISGLRPKEEEMIRNRTGYSFDAIDMGFRAKGRRLWTDISNGRELDWLKPGKLRRFIGSALKNQLHDYFFSNFIRKRSLLSIKIEKNGKNLLAIFFTLFLVKKLLKRG